MNRLMIFVDAEYVIQSLRHLSGKARVSLDEIKWRDMIEWIKGDRYLVRCYYYTALLSESHNPETYRQQQEFLEQLTTVVSSEI